MQTTLPNGSPISVCSPMLSKFKTKVVIDLATSMTEAKQIKLKVGTLKAKELIGHTL